MNVGLFILAAVFVLAKPDESLISRGNRGYFWWQTLSSSVNFTSQEIRHGEEVEKERQEEGQEDSAQDRQVTHPAAYGNGEDRA